MNDIVCRPGQQLGSFVAMEISTPTGISGCVICGKPRLRPETENKDFRTTSYAAVSNGGQALVKLLKIDNDEDLPQVHLYDNYFCPSCSLRNEEIHKILTQIEQLTQSLTRLKDSVEADFKCSLPRKETAGFLRLKITSGNEEDIIRYKIAKKLQLIEESVGGSVSPQSIGEDYSDSEWEPSVIPKVTYSDSESSCAPPCSEEWERLKRLYGIKQCNVNLTPLPPSVLQNLPVQLNQFYSERSSNSSGKSVHGFKCIFADCSSSKVFKTNALLQRHIRSAHEVSSDSDSRSDDEYRPDKSRRTKSTHKFMCIFADCEVKKVFSTEKERDAHVEKAHGILGGRTDKLTTGKSTSGGIQCIFADCDVSEGFSTTEERDAHVERDHGISISSGNKSSQVEKFPTSNAADCDVKKNFALKKERAAHAERDHGVIRSGSKTPKSDKSLRITCIFADCPDCLTFSSEAERDRHVDEAHGEEEDMTEVRPLTCLFADCDHQEPFPDIHAKNAHLNEFHGISPADEGLEPFKKPRKKSTESRKRKVPKCRLRCIFADCVENKVYDTEEDRDLHVRTAHAGNEEADLSQKQPSQDLTNETTPATETLQVLSDDPTKDNEEAKSLPLQCPVKGCRSRRYFPTREEYDMHMKKRHEGVSHPFPCDQCGKKYRHNQELQIHIKTRHLGQYPFICQYCGKGFVSLAPLNIHLPKHTDERNYKCKDCPQAFKTANGLLYHQRSIHTGERPFRCDRCGKGFYSSVKLNNHIKCVHNKEDRPCICHICGKGFPIRNYLYIHLRTHRKGSEGPSPVKKARRRKDPVQAELLPAFITGDNQGDSDNHYQPNNPDGLAFPIIGGNSYGQPVVEENSNSSAMTQSSATSAIAVDLSHFPHADTYHTPLNIPQRALQPSQNPRGGVSMGGAGLLPVGQNLPMSHNMSEFPHLMPGGMTNSLRGVPAQGHPNPLLHQQYFQLMNSFENLNDFHVKL